MASDPAGQQSLEPDTLESPDCKSTKDPQEHHGEEMGPGCADYDGLPCVHEGLCSCGGFSQRNPNSFKGMLRELVIAEISSLKRRRVS